MEIKNIEETSNYSILAKYYDLLLQDEESLSIWLKYINEKDYKTVLELASGSGVMASILENSGKDIIASDLSPEMKEVAANRFKGDYRIIDMSNFEIEKTFDLVLCLCDSINYLNLDSLDTCIKSVYKCLNKNGRFIFDMHSFDRIEEFKYEYIEEGILDDVNYQWAILSDDFDNSLDEIFTFYFKDRNLQERHHQNVFNIDDVEKLMNNNGFKTRIIKNFIPNEKVLVIGEKI